MHNMKWDDVSQEEVKLARKRELITMRNFTEMLIHLIDTSNSLSELSVNLSKFKDKLDKEINK